MRQILLIAAVALLGLTIFSGCSTSGGASPTYSMTATIGSTHMNGTICIAAQVTTVMGISGSTVTSGVTGTPQIHLSLWNWTGATGSYTLKTGGSGNNYAEYVPSSGSLASVSQSGTVTITSISSTTISGTFNFTCTDGKVISSGSFTAQRS